MTFSAFILLLQGLVQFPKELVALIKILRATPAEKADQVIQAAQKESDSLAKTGRPTWD